MRFLLHEAVRRGFLGGSRAWTVLGAALVGARLLRKFAGNEPEVVYREKLRPGEALVIASGKEAVVRPEPS